MKQVYIREVPILLHKIEERRRTRAIEKLYDHQYHFRLAIATLGMAPDKELIQSIAKDLDSRQQNLLGEFESEDEQGARDGIDRWYEEYEGLKQKENPTEEELARMTELKEKMDRHIEKELDKLRGLHTKQKQKKLGNPREG